MVNKIVNYNNSSSNYNHHRYEINSLSTSNSSLNSIEPTNNSNNNNNLVMMMMMTSPSPSPPMSGTSTPTPFNHSSQTTNPSGGGVSRDYTEKTVYLGDLDIETSERQLQAFFDASGVATSKIVKQPHSSYAHVTFHTSDMAKEFLARAIVHINSRVARVMPFNQPNNFDPEANLIIKNLEADLNENNIIAKFKAFGEILSCKLVRDEHGQSKCYAYLQFKERSSASHAIDNLNNTYWDETCDPDFKYRVFQEQLMKRGGVSVGVSQGKLNECNLEESVLLNDVFLNKMGKKIYVGIFKKRDEYSKIKSDKEGRLSNLYVKNFGATFGDRDLFNLFKTYGSIKSAKVRRLRVGPVEKPLGCGFVDFENPDEAEKARCALDGYMLGSGRRISVTYADCKSRRLRKKLEENGNGNNINSGNNNNHHINGLINNMTTTTTTSQSNNNKLVNSGSTSSHESGFDSSNNNNEDDDEEDEFVRSSSSRCCVFNETPSTTTPTQTIVNDVELMEMNSSLSEDDSRERKMSEASNYSLASSTSSFALVPAAAAATTTTAADYWSLKWSRLLQTSQWTEYRLFD